jgi:hypothetical protein
MHEPSGCRSTRPVEGAGGGVGAAADEAAGVAESVGVAFDAPSVAADEEGAAPTSTVGAVGGC